MEFKSLEQLFEENNGRTVVIDRRKYRVRYRRYRGGEDIWLEPVNMRDYLGDDWVTDAKRLEGKAFSEVYRQLAWKQPSTPGRKATTSRKKAPARRR